MRIWQLPLSSPPEIFMMGMSNHRPQRGYDHYRIEGLWCLHFYRYEGELRINGESFPIRPGSCSVTPPSARLEYAYGFAPAIHAVAHFRLEDKAETTVELPAMRELGEEFGELAAAFEAAIPWRASQPARASARLWDVLWRLGESWASAQGESTPGAAHAAVERALHFIEMRLATSLRVEDVAAHAGFSHNHFTRVFAAHAGSTPSQYIRARRVERAKHLLQHSTLPAKAIAAQCGLGDLQAFNKALRRELGVSPRALRGG
jgi:AraC-like DNA-binding protein